MFGMVWTVADAFAAVNAEFIDNMRFSVSDTDGLGGAPLQTGDAAGAFVAVQVYRMKKFIHNLTFLCFCNYRSYFK